MKIVERIRNWKCNHGLHSWVESTLKCPAPNHYLNVQNFYGRSCTNCHIRQFHVIDGIFVSVEEFNALRLRIR